MKNPKHWTHKGWNIERDTKGAFWIAPIGSRKRLVSASTLAEVKQVISARVTQRTAIEQKLAKAGVKTIADLDLIRGNNSRFDALASIFGKDEAHQLLHCLSVGL
jgi:hypothetical protein